MALNAPRFRMMEIIGSSGNNILDVRDILESPIERQAKSLIINEGIDLSDDDEDLGELTDSNEVIHNDPVLDVISAFFGHETEENITDENEKNKEIAEVNNDLSNGITKEDKDVTEKQINNAINTQFERLTKDSLASVRPMKAKLHRDGRVFDVPGGLDFSNAVFNDKLGKLCMEKQEEIESIEKSPVLECNHK